MLEDAPGATTPTCFHHTDREAGRRCTRCGRYACAACLREAAVGSHCWECVKEAAPPRREQVRRRVAAEPLLVAKSLIAANVVAFVWFAVQGAGFSATSASQPELRWTLFAPAIDLRGEWYRIFTSGFVHFGIIHIAFNMIILYQVALVLERVAGHVGFTLIYLVALVAGSLGALLLDPIAHTGGASGAVFGIAGAATLYLWRRGVSFWNTGYGPLIAINLVLTFVAPGISIGGHIGGLLGGLAAGAVLLPGWIQPATATSASTRRATYGGLVVLIVTLVGACAWAATRWPSAL